MSKIFSSIVSGGVLSWAFTASAYDTRWGGPLDELRDTVTNVSCGGGIHLLKWFHHLSFTGGSLYAASQRVEE